MNKEYVMNQAATALDFARVNDIPEDEAILMVARIFGVYPPELADFVGWQISNKQEQILNF